MSAHYLNSPPCFGSPGISQRIAPDGCIVNVVPLASPAGSGGIGQADPEPEPSSRILECDLVYLRGDVEQGPGEHSFHRPCGVRQAPTTIPRVRGGDARAGPGRPADRRAYIEGAGPGCPQPTIPPHTDINGKSSVRPVCRGRALGG